VPEISLEQLVEEMMQSDLRLFKRDKYLKEGGYQTFNYFE
jgi:GDPmannose 4,6-dehydratase